MAPGRCPGPDNTLYMRLASPALGQLAISYDASGLRPQVHEVLPAPQVGLDGFLFWDERG
jgi:hypothetical protein